MHSLPVLLTLLFAFLLLMLSCWLNEDSFSSLAQSLLSSSHPVDVEKRRSTARSRTEAGERSCDGTLEGSPECASRHALAAG